MNFNSFTPTDNKVSVLELKDICFSYQKNSATKVPNKNVSLVTNENFVANSASKTRQNESKNTISHLSLSLTRGETILLTGPSGSGKSSLTRIINGLIPSFYPGKLSGEIKYLGKEIPPEEQALPNLVSTVFQNPRTQFFSTDTTAELAFNCENLNIPSAEIRQRIKKYTQLCQTEKLLNRSVFALSGGEKQILATTAAIISQPHLYLFDEPSANLDPQAITRLRDIFQELRKQNATMIINEHRLYWLKDLVDRVLYLEAGQIRHSYSGEEFFRLSSEQCRQLGLRSLSLPSWKIDHQLNVQENLTISEISQPESSSSSLSHIKTNSAPNNTPTEVPHGETETTSTPRQNSILPDGIELKQLTFSYGKSTDKNLISINRAHFRPGEISIITGENGVGKSTLAQLICGLKKPKSGCIINAATQKKLSPQQLQKLSFQIMQECPHQLFTSSCFEEIFHSTGDKDQALSLLAKYGLYPLDSQPSPHSEPTAKPRISTKTVPNLADAHPQILSGGEMQRLCLAVAESLNKEIYLFDEPTSGLDASHLSQVKALLNALAQDGKVVLIITHDQELIASLSGVVYNMNRI